MSPVEEKRRKSIAYILRRRKRGRKVGANSGKVVKSWAEASEVNFKPSGAPLKNWRWLTIPGWLVAVSIPWVFMAVVSLGNNRHPSDIWHPELPLVGWILVFAALALIFIIGAFALAYIGLTLWRLTNPLRHHKNE